MRVETQVFTLVNDTGAANFNEFGYEAYQATGYHQPKTLPIDTGTPVEYLGSATGPKYEQH
nr:delta-class carbonic anhydrase [Bowmanella yangjiangensis]